MSFFQATITALKAPLFKKSPLAKAKAELREAEIELMQAHTGLDYAQAMVAYNSERVRRLNSTIQEETGEFGNSPQLSSHDVVRLMNRYRG